MLRHGLPLERLSPRPSYQVEFRQACNAEDSLLAVIGAFQRTTQEISNIDFPTPDAFGVLLARLQGQRTSEGNPMSFRCLTYLNLSGCLLRARDFSGVDLSGSDLSGGNFFRANLSGANLSEADLSGANLSGANLSGADLKGANLFTAQNITKDQLNSTKSVQNTILP